MGNLLKLFGKIFEQDGAMYGSTSMSVDIDWLENNRTSIDISKKIQDLWDQKVDDKGFSKPTTTSDHEEIPGV